MWAPSLVPSPQGLDDLLGGLDLGGGMAGVGPPPDLPTLLTDTAKGVVVKGRLARHVGGIGYHLSITNTSVGECTAGTQALGSLRSTNTACEFLLVACMPASSPSGFLDGFMFQTNRNSFGLTPSNQVRATVASGFQV